MPGTVTVGCKLPHGLVMRLFSMEDHEEPVMGGGVRVVKRARQSDSRSIRLHGAARYADRDPEHTIVTRAGITYGVDADFFAEWQKQNKDADYARFVFGSAKPGDVEAWAREVKAVSTGFERIDVGALPSEFRGKITAADKRD